MSYDALFSPIKLRGRGAEKQSSSPGDEYKDGQKQT